MRRIVRSSALSGAIVLASSLSASVLAQVVEPPEVAPLPPTTPPVAAETPAVLAVPAAEADPLASDAIVLQVAPKNFAARLAKTFDELARLAEEIEALDKVEPSPPNAAILRAKAMASIRDSWNAATRSVARLPQDVQADFEGADKVWEREQVTAADLRAASAKIAGRLAQRKVAQADVAVVPTEIPLKTKTMQAVLAELTRPATATFPADWDGAYDDAVDRYVFDDVLETRDAQDLVRVVPFRAEWAYADGAWQLAFLRVNGEVSVDRPLKSVLAPGERPALIVQDVRIDVDPVAQGAGTTVSALKGAYLAYPPYLADSRVWISDAGTPLRAKLIRARTTATGAVVELQVFGEENRTLPLAQLSRNDQDFVVDWIKRNPQSIPPTISTPE